MSYYYNRTVIKGNEDYIIELEGRLLNRRGQTITLNDFKEYDNYTEVIEIKDHEMYTDIESDDMMLDLNYAALGYPVVKFWENDCFKIDEDSMHEIIVESYNPIEQIYIYNRRYGNEDNEVETRSLMPNHSFLTDDELCDYYNAVATFISYSKLNTLMDKFLGEDKAQVIKDLILKKLEEV